MKNRLSVNSLSMDCGVVYSGFKIIERNSGESVDILEGYSGDILKRILMANVIGNPSHLIRRKVFEKVGGYDEALESIQDWVLWIRISRISKFKFISEILATYYIGGTQISTNLNKEIRGKMIILNKYYMELKRFPSIISNHLNRIGILYTINGDYLSAIDYFLKALIHKPVQRYAYYALSKIVIAPNSLRKKFLREIPFRLNDKYIFY